MKSHDNFLRRNGGRWRGRAGWRCGGGHCGRVALGRWRGPSHGWCGERACSGLQRPGFFSSGKLNLLCAAVERAGVFASVNCVHLRKLFGVNFNLPLAVGAVEFEHAVGEAWIFVFHSRPITHRQLTPPLRLRPAFMDPMTLDFIAPTEESVQDVTTLFPFVAGALFKI